eukprot:m.185731 g.185731  ORF g.185731 m.185731 type:complete len:65 (-) comp32240_c0_seq4:38-232(-)
MLTGQSTTTGLVCSCGWTASSPTARRRWARSPFSCEDVCRRHEDVTQGECASVSVQTNEQRTNC